MKQGSKGPQLSRRHFMASAAAGVGLHLCGDATLATASAPAAFLVAFLGYLAVPLLLRRDQPQGDLG